MTTTLHTRRPNPPHDGARSELRAFLRAIAGPAIPGSLFEIRERHGQLMRRRFIAIEQPDQAASAILRATRDRDVYLGAAPRARPHGGRAGIAVLSTLWVDADSQDAIERLQSFEPAPSIVIATGRGRHAYWLLDHTVDPAIGEDTNRRLAQHLHADQRCADAARILRPPHTINYAYDPTRPVGLLHLDARRQALGALVAALPEPPTTTQATRERLARTSGGDPLLTLAPAFYVGVLLNTSVGPERKLSCPFHEDTHPSLHVYATPDQGWHCFSCRRGGSIYDLGAALWDLPPRGHTFLLLRQRLQERLLGETS